MTALERVDPGILGDFSFDYTTVTPTAAAGHIPTEQVSFNYTKISFNGINPDSGPSLSDFYHEIGSLVDQLPGDLHVVPPMQAHDAMAPSLFIKIDVHPNRNDTGTNSNHLLHLGDDLLV